MTGVQTCALPICGSFTETQQLASTLNHANHQLQKIDTLRRDLIANLSHDIRTPLTDIRAYAEMIRDISGDRPEKREKHLNVIIRETEYLSMLINDMNQLTAMQSDNIHSSVSGTILKLREKGVANVNNGKKGDMLVTVNIETPTNLSKNQIEALKAFDKLESKQKPWDKFKNMFKN